MQANPSSRWKNEVVELVKEHDFKYDHAYDAGSEFRQDDHQCDFCGTHLRYTAVIYAEDDKEIEREVGLDCLEHAFGTGWSKMQDVERDIKELKEEAKRKRRREEYQEEYGNLMEWIRKYLDIRYNGFLESMLEILETGSKKWTRGMDDAVRDIVNETDLEELKKEQRDKERKKESQSQKIQKVIGIIERVDDRIDPSEDEDKKRSNCSAYDFAVDVHEFLERRGYITDNQMSALNDIYKDYKEKKEKVSA